MDKLNQFEQIVKILDKDNVTQQEFVSYFEQLISFVQSLKESNDIHIGEIKVIASDLMDKCMAQMEKAYASEWAKIKARVDTIKDGIDGQIGPQGVQGIQGQEGKQGKQGPEGKPGDKGLDLFPNTPNEEVDKINEATNQIDAERIRDLKELITRVSLNAVPPTTTHFFRDGIPFGRAKNINMIHSTMEMNQAGDQAIITPIVVSTTAPPNPFYLQLWLDIS